MENNGRFPRNGSNILSNNNNFLRRGVPMWQFVKDGNNFVMWGANVAFLIMKIINTICLTMSFRVKIHREIEAICLTFGIIEVSPRDRSNLSNNVFP